MFPALQNQLSMLTSDHEAEQRNDPESAGIPRNQGKRLQVLCPASDGTGRLLPLSRAPMTVCPVSAGGMSSATRQTEARNRPGALKQTTRQALTPLPFSVHCRYPLQLRRDSPGMNATVSFRRSSPENEGNSKQWNQGHIVPRSAKDMPWYFSGG